MGIEAASGVVLILRLLFFIVAVTIFVSAFETSLATILSLGAIFGTALGLAFSQALGNIVSGLYVVAARPFRVGDYVRIGNVEGVVKEITLNYTRVLLADETHQLVPNNKVVGSEVTNYRIEDLPGLIEGKEEKIEAIVDKISKSILPKWYANVSNDTMEYVIFHEKIFKHKKGDKKDAQEAISYGISVGIPANQLDWI